MSTQTIKVIPACSLALIAAALIPVPSHADVRYTMEMKMGGDKSGQDDGAAAMGGSIRTTTFLKDMRQRDETATDFGPIKMTTVTITQCDKHREVKLDPDLKIYTVSAIGAFLPAKQMSKSPMMTSKADDQGAGGTGKEVVTFTAKNLGTEKVADIQARHAMLTFRTQSSGCAGASDTTMKMELWTAPIKAALNCPERYSASRVIPNEKGCPITYEMKGDLAGLRDIFGEMAVKQVFYDANDKPLFTRDLREHSTAALDDSLFDVPSDYKEVSDDEFQKQERDKMMHSFMPGGKMPGAGADETPATPEGDTADGPAPTPDPKPEKPKHKFKVPGLPF
ncbi:hypothetical protein CCAX7_004780 [Capsulimonas corticalis]|uniref:Uncharacterized protein n=1 Tax=Capsulimonas corticalis TaxID=2219043 RepID=A0A402D2R4_9BACT|nr:hypothetical protein [Capsulimonas corticalis]BDI28427.1 hypothetical protein CCAX7_004780 [Capsulimonas corticalis]